MIATLTRRTLLNLVLLTTFSVGSFLLPSTSHAVLEDYECPENYSCKGLMPDIEFWVNRWGVYDKNQTVYYDSHFKNIYYVLECEGPCYKDPQRYVVRTRIEEALPIVVSKIEEGRSDFEGEYEKSIANSILSAQGYQNITLEWYKDNRGNKLRENQNALKRLRHEFGLKSVFRAGLPTYKFYKDYIVDVLEQHNLSTELQFLPFVESQYDPIKSVDNDSAKATGLWQFLPGTGRIYDLQVDSLFDDRRDPYKATKAAAEYFIDSMKQLNDAAVACSTDGLGLKIDQMIPFMVTSFVYGPGIKNAFKTTGTNYLEVRCNWPANDFYTSSQAYYPQYLAAIHIGQNERKYFGEETDPHQPLEATQILQLSSRRLITSITNKISIPRLSEEFKELKYLNLRYADKVWKGITPLPVDSVIIFPYDHNTIEPLQSFGKLVIRDETELEPIEMRKLENFVVTMPDPQIKEASTSLLPQIQYKQPKRNFIDTLISIVSKNQ